MLSRLCPDPIGIYLAEVSVAIRAKSMGFNGMKVIGIKRTLVMNWNVQRRIGFLIYILILMKFYVGTVFWSIFRTSIFRSDHLFRSFKLILTSCRCRVACKSSILRGAIVTTNLKGIRTMKLYIKTNKE